MCSEGFSESCRALLLLPSQLPPLLLLQPLCPNQSSVRCLGLLLAAGLPSAPLQRRLGAVPGCHSVSPRAAAGFLHRVSHSQQAPRQIPVFSHLLVSMFLPLAFPWGFAGQTQAPAPRSGEDAPSRGSVPRGWDTQHPPAHRAPGWQLCSTCSVPAATTA